MGKHRRLTCEFCCRCFRSDYFKKHKCKKESPKHITSGDSKYLCEFCGKCYRSYYFSKHKCQFSQKEDKPDKPIKICDCCDKCTSSCRTRIVKCFRCKQECYIFQIKAHIKECKKNKKKKKTWS